MVFFIINMFLSRSRQVFVHNQGMLCQEVEEVR
uniref:Uncharacterized protein n=1 Tax=Rhizophora mucronata TaxID=61149 RepID=A0A2P2LL40_RHIMU